MKAQKIANVLAYYIEELKGMGFQSEQLEVYTRLPKELPENAPISHALWMCEEAMDFTKRKRFFFLPDLGKANRWLGFIQGVLWMANLFPISSMRDHNRPD